MRGKTRPKSAIGASLIRKASPIRWAVAPSTAAHAGPSPPRRRAGTILAGLFPAAAEGSPAAPTSMESRDAPYLPALSAIDLFYQALIAYQGNSAVAWAGGPGVSFRVARRGA